MNALIILLAMALFGVIHSLLAAQTLKAAVRRRLGERAYEGLYRFAYNFVAVVSFAPIAALMLLVPGVVIWRAENPAVMALLLLIQLVGVVGFLVASFQVDLGQFGGLAQLVAYLKGEPLPLPPEPLQTGGLYALVRHPLYLCSLMVIWAMQTMTDTLLAFNIGTTVYLVFGSLLEERRLEAAFGDSYRDYRRRVPWLLPFVRLPASMRKR